MALSLPLGAGVFFVWVKATPHNAPSQRRSHGTFYGTSKSLSNGNDEVVA